MLGASVTLASYYLFGLPMSFRSARSVPLPFLTASFRLCSAAIIRGCGRQMLGASITLASYYLIGLPMSVLMGLVWKWGAFVSETCLALIACNSSRRLALLRMRLIHCEELLVT